MTSVWTSGRFEPGCAVSATAALHLPSQSRLRWIIGEGSQHHATVCRKAFDNPKYQYNFYLICNHNITQYVSDKIEFGSTNDRSVKHTRAFRIRFSISRR